MHVVIIGAGIVGVATAHALLDQGYRVTLVDRADPTAPSRGNAGLIAHTDILPLATPSMVWQAARWLTDPLRPLAIRPAYLPRLDPWLARFLPASLPGPVDASMEGVIP